MNQEQSTISYDQFKALLPEEQRKVFSEASPEHRALLMKTQIQKWLDTNLSRLNQEQIAVIEEMLRFVTPDKYQADRDYEKVTQEADKLFKKAEAVLPREDVIQMTFVAGGQCATRQARNE